MEHHSKRKADKHKSQYAGGHVVKAAARLESPTYRSRCPRNAYIHRHHGDRQDHSQQCDLQGQLVSLRRDELTLDCPTEWRSPCWQRSVSFVRPEHRRVRRSPQGRFRRVTRDPRVERVARPGLEHAQAAPGQIYNCGDEHQITTREWVEMSAAELGYRWGIGW